MKNTVIIGFLLITAIFTSCSKDPLSPTSTLQKYVIEFNPDTLRGNIYQDLTVKARVNGLETETLFSWDYGDGSKSIDTGSSITKHTYFVVGNYTLSAKAFHYFTDTLITEGSIPVIISEPTPKVIFEPHTIDTVLPMDIYGKLLKPLFSRLQFDYTSTPLRFAYHIVGSGYDTTVLSDRGDLYFNFPRAGKYIVSAEVTRESGALYGRDTETVNVRFPAIDIDMIRSSPRVSVVFNVDPNSSIYHSENFANPLSLELPFIHSAPYDFSWSGGDFAANYNVHTVGTGTYDDKNEEITGSLSSDIQTLVSCKVSVNDTTYSSSIGGSSNAKWGYTFKNLKLISVTSKEIVYGIVGQTMSDFSSDLNFEFTKHNFPSDDPCANPITIVIGHASSNLTPPPAPNGFVIFSR